MLSVWGDGEVALPWWTSFVALFIQGDNLCWRCFKKLVALVRSAKPARLRKRRRIFSCKIQFKIKKTLDSFYFIEVETFFQKNKYCIVRNPNESKNVLFINWIKLKLSFAISESLVKDEFSDRGGEFKVNDEGGTPV